MQKALALILSTIAGCVGPQKTEPSPTRPSHFETGKHHQTAAQVEKQKETPAFPPDSPPRRLFLGLDGIGYEQFKKMQAGGYFRSFRPVAPMVATFPSISDPNWAKIMHAPLEVSFTKEHFDKTQENGKGQVTGGLLDHVFHPPVYEEYFDYKAESPFERIASMAYSETSGIYWLDALEKYFFESRGKFVYKAFIANTDFIAHTKGERDVFRFLAELDKKLDLLRQKYHEKYKQNLEVILVSDHGNVFLKPKAVNIENILKEDGWNLTTTLNNEKDVVVVIPEILSFAPFFVKPKEEAALAKTLSRAEGVHVSFCLSGPTQVDFFSRFGVARAELNLKNRRLRYVVLQGKDPFNQLKLFKGRDISFAEYFRESAATDYPNALVRAFEGLSQNSLQKPSVLVSPILGYVFSNKTLELVTKIMGLESVHGSFHKSESLGIFVSTDQDLPTVSPTQVLQFVD